EEACVRQDSRDAIEASEGDMSAIQPLAKLVFDHDRRVRRQWVGNECSNRVAGHGRANVLPGKSALHSDLLFRVLWLGGALLRVWYRTLNNARGKGSAQERAGRDRSSAPATLDACHRVSSSNSRSGVIPARRSPGGRVCAHARVSRTMTSSGRSV